MENWTWWRVKLWRLENRWLMMLWRVRMLRMKALLKASELMWKAGHRLQMTSSRMLMALMERNDG